MVARGLTYVSPAIAALVVASGVAAAGTDSPATPDLSPRERQVLQLLAEGRSSKEIAGQLDIAVATVETHRRQIMDKVDLRTTAALTKYAIRQGLTSLE